MERELRKNESTLASVGTGIMWFGIWSAIKSILIFVSNVTGTTGDLAKFEGMEHAVAVVVLVMIMALMVIIPLKFHFYVGRAARAEARGEKRKGAYIVIAGIMFAFNILGIVLNIWIITTGGFSFNGQDSIDEMLVTVIVDITLAYLLLLMMITAVKVWSEESRFFSRAS